MSGEVDTDDFAFEFIAGNLFALGVVEGLGENFDGTRDLLALSFCLGFVVGECVQADGCDAKNSGG